GRLVQPLELLPRLLGVVERLLDRVLAAVERGQQRPPPELREQRQQHQNRQDRPDEQPGIELDERIINVRLTQKWRAPAGNFNTMSSANTSARIATPSSRKSGRFTAPVILSEAFGWRAMLSAAAAASLPMPSAAPITAMPSPSAAPNRCRLFMP